MRFGSRALIRDINRSLVLNLVRERGPLPRAEIARISGLSPSTVTAITAALIAEGFIVEDAGGGQPRSRTDTIGRPASPLSVDPSAGFVVGVKVAAEAITASLVDLAATPIQLLSVPHPADLGARDLAGMLAGAVEQLAASGGVAPETVLGVGIGVPGIVDPRNWHVEGSPLVQVGDVDIADLVADRVGLPVHIDNDVNTLTVAEQLFGAGRGFAHFVVVTVGRGIGMGAVVNGALYRGAHGGAGELGHVVVIADGAPCWCGRRGCLETVASEPAIVREVLAATGQLVQPADQAALAARDPRVARIHQHAGTVLGRAIANARTILDPERVIIAGEGVRLGDVFLEAVEAALEEGKGQQIDMRSDVVISAWGDEAWARGAATLVLRELFHPAHLRDEGPPPSVSRQRQKAASGSKQVRGGTR